MNDSLLPSDAVNPELVWLQSLWRVQQRNSERSLLVPLEHLGCLAVAGLQPVNTAGQKPPRLLRSHQRLLHTALRPCMRLFKPARRVGCGRDKQVFSSNVMSAPSSSTTSTCALDVLASVCATAWEDQHLAVKGTPSTEASLDGPSYDVKDAFSCCSHSQPVEGIGFADEHKMDLDPGIFSSAATLTLPQHPASPSSSASSCPQFKTELASPEMESKPGLLLLLGRVGCSSVLIKVDLGADHNFICSELAGQLQSQILPGSFITFTNGGPVRLDAGSVSATFGIGTYCGSSQFVIGELDANVPLVLGKPWLTQHRAIVDCAFNLVEWEHDGQRFLAYADAVAPKTDLEAWDISPGPDLESVPSFDLISAASKTFSYLVHTV